MDNNTVTVDGRTMSLEAYQEMCQSLPDGTKLVETAPNSYVTVTRLNG